MPDLVNLDALVKREDFQVLGEAPEPSALSTTLKVTELTEDSVTFHMLRKPDFQRETANWTPEKVAELIQSFLDGDLIPSVILWRSQGSGNIFVIDGSHRVSALIAWVHDDYGDGQISRKFYENLIPPEQIKAAERTRRKVSNQIGSFQELLAAGRNPSHSSPESVRRSRAIGSYAVQLQWVQGDAKRAEDSFFKINQKATPIDPTELEMIKSRKKANAVAARAILRSGVGHRYWSDFSEERQAEVKSLAHEIYQTLFTPALESPVKTLDLPVAGRGYSAASVRLIFEFANLANGLSTDKKREGLTNDKDGSQTIKFLKNAHKLARRISGTHPSSLGLHPAVYFYGATGRYQPPAFLATVRFVQYLDERNLFNKFTEYREKFEDFLLRYRYFTNQIVSKYGGGRKSLEPFLTFYKTLFDAVCSKKSNSNIIECLKSADKLRHLREHTEQDRQHKEKFSRDTKSLVYLREALENSLRCAICNARIHKKSISYDHIQRMEDGGDGNPDNAQLTHPYCNSGFRESRHSKKRQ